MMKEMKKQQKKKMKMSVTIRLLVEYKHTDNNKLLN